MRKNAKGLGEKEESPKKTGKDTARIRKPSIAHSRAWAKSAMLNLARAYKKRQV